MKPIQALTGVLLITSLIGCLAAVQFRIKNNSQREIRIGILGNDNKPALASGGFILAPNQEKSVTADNNWAGRFWARTWCNPSTNHCETGDCGNKVQCAGSGGVPPVTLVEITLRGHEGKDFYDISLVDGFNIAARISPISGSGTCKNIGCTADINRNCPEELKLYSNTAGFNIGCKSSCLRYNTDQYCCRNAYGSPQSCKPNDWKVNSAKYFKEKCPDAYSYAYDDASSTFTCTANTYLITFG